MARVRKRPLTPKQAVFVREYLIDLNATQAAIRAGYSKRTADKQGWQLLGHPRIQSALEQALRSREKRTEITQDRVLKELAKLAFSDMRSFAKWNPDAVILVDSDQLTDIEAACVAEITQTITKDGGNLKLKLHDKKGALELLGKHLDLFADRVKVTGDLEIVVKLPENLAGGVVDPNFPGDLSADQG